MKKYNLSHFYKNKFYLIFSLLIILFLIIKISFIGFKFSDENVYFYMGNAILEGAFPYKDFFFASPPLHLLIISFFILIFQKIIFLKLLPIIFTIITSIFIFKISKLKFNSKIALFSSIIFLFSFLILSITDHSTAIHLTILFLSISYYLILKDKFFISGIIASLALLTRLYSGIAILGILVYLLIKNKKQFLYYSIGIASVFIPVNAILILFFKKSYLTSVYFYHLLKSTGISKSKIFLFFIKNDFPIVFLSFISIFLKKRRKIIFILIPLFIIILFYLFYSDIYYLYLGLLMPFLAILAGFSLYEITKKSKYSNSIVFIFLIFLIIFNTGNYIINHSNTAKIEFIEEISEYINKNSLENQTIYGSFEITPIVALKSERKITKNYIDTNTKSFLSGIFNISKRTKALEKSDLKFVLIKTLINSNNSPLYIEGIIEKDYLSNNCKIAKIYRIKKDYEDNAVIVYDCNY